MKIAVLTEGNSSIGYGHISRCISIGQALKEAGHVIRFIINGDDRVQGIPNVQDALVYDWYVGRDRLSSDLGGQDALFIDAITVPDDLLFDLMARKKCAVIDDYKRRTYSSGLIIDWTILAEVEHVPPPSEGVTFLLGAKYAALRKGFWMSPVRQVRKTIGEILITFGGTDIRGLTSKAIPWMEGLCPQSRITAVVGNGVMKLDEIKSKSINNTRVLINLNEEQMASVMSNADLALAAGGQTLYELARMGVPTLAVTVVDNQIDDVNGWGKTGFLLNVGWWDDPDLYGKICKGFGYFSRVENRTRHASIGRSTIDGLGAGRIVKKMEELFR